MFYNFLHLSDSMACDMFMQATADALVDVCAEHWDVICAVNESTADYN